MKILVLMLVLILIFPAVTYAQTDYQVIYVNDAQEVIALNPATGEQTILLQMQASTPQITSYGLHTSPDGQKVAIFQKVFAQMATDSAAIGFRLYLVINGQFVFEQNLLPEGYVYPGIGLGDPAYEMTLAIGEMKWSPDSRYLAYTSGQNGSADIFLFDTATQSTVPLENGANQAFFLHWSPESTALLYTDVESFGTGAGISPAGFYKIPIPTGEIQPLGLTLQENQAYSAIGWLDANTLLYSPQSFIAGASGLHTLDLSTLASTEILPATVEITVPVFDPGSQTAVFIAPEMGGLTGGLASGVYSWTPGLTTPHLIQSGSFYFAEFVSAGRFQIQSDAGSFLYDGATLLPLPAADFGTFISPAADAVVLYRSDGVYVSHLSADDAALVSQDQAQVPIWSPDGTHFYSFGFTDEGGGLVEFDVINRTVRLLDMRMMFNSLIAIAP